MESLRPPYFSRISGADSSSDQSELQVCLKPGSKRHVGIIDNRYMTTFQWYLTDVPQQTSYHNTTQHTSYQENSPKIRITCTHWSFSYRLVLGHWTGHPSPGGKYDRYIYILTAGNTGKMFNNDKNDQWPFHSSGLYFTWHSPRRALQAQSLYRSSKHLCHHVRVVHDVIVGDNGFVGDYDIVGE